MSEDLAEAVMEEVKDPFSDEHVGTVQAITLMRCYDVLMTLLQLQSPEKAEDLLKLHAAGVLVGPSPALSGDFVFDAVNTPAESGDQVNDTAEIDTSV